MRESAAFDVCQLLANCRGTDGGSRWVLTAKLGLLGALHERNKARALLSIAMVLRVSGGEKLSDDVRNYTHASGIRSKF